MQTCILPIKGLTRSPRRISAGEYSISRYILARDNNNIKFISVLKIFVHSYNI